MERKSVMYGARLAMVTGIFAIGFMCGTISQRNADAQLGDLGSELMQKAKGSGGLIGTVAELGTAIADMQKQVDGLQKNLGVLKKVKTSLGGK